LSRLADQLRPSLHTEELLDVLFEGIVDLGVPLDGLFLAGGRVEINIVS